MGKPKMAIKEDCWPALEAMVSSDNLVLPVDRRKKLRLVDPPSQGFSPLF